MCIGLPFDDMLDARCLRLSHIAFLFVLTSFWFGGCRPGQVNKDSRPANVIIIITDDQGWGDLSLTGNPLVRTPRMDQLAQEGALFTHFFAHAVCSPTRASLLTGRYAVRGGVYSTSTGGERLDLDETTFAQAFLNHGYRTAAFGKWHNGMQYPYHPNGRGFEEFYGYCAGHWGSYVDAPLEHNGELVTSQGYLTDDLTQRALTYIEQHQSEPFLVYLALNTPHSPMQVLDTWWNRIDSSKIPLHRYRAKEDTVHTRAVYAMCENIDWNVGRVLDQLSDLQLTEETLVVFLSDNGPNGWRWNDGLEGKKGKVDEGGVKVPFIMRWPGKIHENTVVDPIAADIDLAPTLLDLVGIVAPPSRPYDGKSLRPLLFQDTTTWAARTLINHWQGRTSVRTDRYRLDAKGHLFDMQHDPGQTHDISTQHPDIQATLIKAKEAWEQEVLAELPQTDERPFIAGHPHMIWTQLPARDAYFSGGIKRSNRWPNCSFLTNWTQLDDEIGWEIEVPEAGTFEAILYYTCPVQDTGSVIQLSWADQATSTSIQVPHDPPLRGMEYDRIAREESYVKDFWPLALGKIHLSAGKGILSLRALQIPHTQVADVRLLMLKRIG